MGSLPAHPEPGRPKTVSSFEAGLIWLMAHASSVWPFVVFLIVLGLSWHALKEVHPREFSLAFRGLDRSWLVTAGLLTAVNIAAMGFYDVVAFPHTKARWTERWQYGAVCFAWSNFLTLGPLAGPAMRFWLYRSSVGHLSDLHAGVVSIAVAFTGGLAGWVAAVLVAVPFGAGPFASAVLALATSIVAAAVAMAVLRRIERLSLPDAGVGQTLKLALIGWLDWLLAAAAFVACLQAVQPAVSTTDLVRSFFLGQALGLASLVPGGIGSSDAFWIAHLPLGRSTAAAILMAYRLVYYVVPWAIASLVLLAWVTGRTPRRLEMARRIVAGLVGGGGGLIMLSAASPSLYARLPLLERFVPLPLVEAGHVAAAFAGLLLVVLARGLSRGYRAAFRITLALLAVAGFSAILKGFDWEEAIALGGLAIATWSQAALFTRPSRGDPWFEASDVTVAVTALAAFLVFGSLSHRLTAERLERWSHIGYRFQAARFLRTAASMGLAVAAGSLYVLMRAPVRFSRLDDADAERALALHGRIGRDTNPLMVAAGDKAVFFDEERGFCLYRIIGPYLVVFSDPVTRAATDRRPFLDALFGFAGEIDRRPVFYQVSLDWVPVLHDRGYDFFKLGEEAHVLLDRVTLEGHAGKMYRQILRRAERDGLRFRILPPAELSDRLGELRAVSDEWLRDKELSERQFSIGSFDERYLSRFPCAIVEGAGPAEPILAFANLLEGPGRRELSVDLMRYRSGGPSLMDFLIVSLLLYGKSQGYGEFNLGMAPLASVGELRGAHARERLARLLFQRGQRWYNFQGLRFYKDKFDPVWMPRYMAYQNAWEWPMAIAYVSALIAGGWSRIFASASSAKAPGAPTAPADAPAHA